MSGLVGHVLPGLVFFLLGLWHLFNNTKMYVTRPSSYKSITWFPAPKIRYLELYFIILATFGSISLELFIGQKKHQPFDLDGTIPTTHLHNFEHTCISLSFLVYAVSCIVLDKTDKIGLTQLCAALAFGQELLLFHLHSTDHTELEGHYHMFLQLLIFVSVASTLFGIGFPTSFLVSYVRSLCIFFQGVWLLVIGCMFYTPGIIPKGCFMVVELDVKLVHCRTEAALYRAKSLVTIQFSWYVTGMTIFAVLFYKRMVEIYGEKVEYTSLLTKGVQDEEQETDHKTATKIKFGDFKGKIDEFVVFDVEK